MSDLASIFPFSARHVGVVEHGYEDRPIVGRVQRTPTMTKEQATVRARSMPWWRAGLVLDTRCSRWWVWRGRG